MNQQQPQQPGWGQPQHQPQQPQPGYGPPPQGWGAPQPQPPKKSNTGKIIGLGCAGVVALFVVLGIFGAALGGGSDDSGKGSTVSADDTTSPAAEAQKDEPAEAKTSDKPKADEPKKEDTQKVVFKVWGTAPAGALGPLDITYGSDSDNRKGAFKNGEFEASLTLDEDALYYTVHAQLQGSGDINCSVTVDGKTKKGHASGGYNICSAQANAGLLGGWD